MSLLQPKHVLICRTDNIGDVVITFPVMSYLKSIYPQLTIGLLCRSYVAPIAQYCRSIDYVIESDTLQDPVATLAQSGADTIIFFPGSDKKLAKAAKKAKIAIRIGLQHRLSHWLYCTHFAKIKRKRSTRHEAQLSFQLLQPLGIHFIPELINIPNMYQLTAPTYNGSVTLDSKKFHVILHPKSNGNGREWPIQHYVALTQLLSTTHSEIHFWITGSPKEGQWMTEHAPEFIQQTNVTNVCGAFNLDQFIAFINTVDGLIASGTGPLHVSAALGKPTLGLFPPIRPISATRWAPLGSQAEALTQTQHCKPCEKNSTGCTPVIKSCLQCDSSLACLCMQNIHPKQVAQILLTWQAARQRNPQAMINATIANIQTINGPEGKSN